MGRAGIAARETRPRRFLSRGVRVLAAAVLAGSFAEAACRAFRRFECRRPPSDVFELYAVGESTAVGQPYDEGISPVALAARILGGSIHGKRIVTTILAERGESVYPQAEALENALCCRRPGVPGAVFVYAGHNDAGDAEQTPFFEYFKEDVLFRSELLKTLFFFAEKNRLIPLVRTRQTYEFNLRRIVEASRRAGLVPVLATTASNFAGIDPGLRPESAGPRAVAIISEGAALESRGRWEEALSYYRASEDAHPELGDYLRYRMAACHRRLGHDRIAAALLRACVEARAQDNFGRARAEQNELIRRLAREYAIPLVDFERIASRASPLGAPGDELFSDGHHPNIRGYALLSNALADAVARAFDAPAGAPLAVSDRLFADLGRSREEQADALVSSGNWLFSVGVDHAYPFQRWSMAQDRFRRAVALDPDDFDARLGLALASAALKGDFVSRNVDWLGKKNLFYGRAHDFSPEDWQEILLKLKSEGVPQSQLRELSRTYGIARRKGGGAQDGSPVGSLGWRERVERAVAAGDRRTAFALMKEQENSNPDAESRLLIAITYQDIKEYARAAALLETLVRERPLDAGRRADLGICRYLKGDPEAALSDLRAALRLDPNRLATYRALGSVETALGRRDEALQVIDAGLAAEGGRNPQFHRELIEDRKAALQGR